MRNAKDTIINIVLVVLIVALILFMFVSFVGTGESFSIVNPTKQGEKVMSGSEEVYNIYLKTVDPVQYETALHYRVQYGRWRIEDAFGEELSPGIEKEIENGVYETSIIINIPYGETEMYLIADILEYQYSASNPEGPWIRDNGIIRSEEKLKIEVYGCIGHADCNIDICLGQFGYCEEGICEVRGDCQECVSNDDCGIEEGITYECVNFACKPFIEPTMIDKVKEVFVDPITEPGPVIVGELPQKQEAPVYLNYLVFFMVLLVAYLIYRMKRK